VSMRVRDEVESSTELRQSLGDKVHQVFENIKEKKMDLNNVESGSSDNSE